MTYFISDLHFGHKNCLSFDARPFKTVEEMDQAIIDRWNETVGFDDDAWILGDISWYNSTKTIELLKQLNGRLHLCRGNHDNKLLRNPQLRNMFVEIVDIKEIDLGNNLGLILSHYPIPCFKNHYYGWYHLYGHVHTSFEWNMMRKTRQEMEELYTVPCRMCNVGCMMTYMDYTPRPLEYFIDLFEKGEI